MMKLIVFALLLTQVFGKKPSSGRNYLKRRGKADKRVIMPGTLWCGMGNQAASENDLGRLADVDSCCRDHDHCDRKVDGFSKEYGYRNWRPFTVSDCDCDKKFYKCLKNAKENPTEATIVGKLFFNILSMPCLRFNTFGTTARKGHSPSYK